MSGSWRCEESCAREADTIQGTSDFTREDVECR